MAKERIVELVSCEINSFRGINKSGKILIDFTQRKKGQNATEIAGPHGKGKTSSLTGIAFSLAAKLGIDKKRLMNSIDGDIDVATVIKVDGEKHKIEVSPTRLTVKRAVEGEDKWSAKGIEQAPQEFLEEVLGRVMFIPAELQFMKGKDQIEFFRQMFGSGEEAGKKMKELETRVEKVFNDRRDANREVKSLTAALEMEPLFQNYEKSQNRFEKTISAEKEKAKYEDTKKRFQQFESHSQALSSLRELAQSKEEEIAELEARLAAAKKEKAEADDRIKKGEKWVADNKAIVSEWKKAEDEWLDLSKTLSEQDKWRDIQRREKAMIEKQDQAMEFDRELVTLREDIMKLTKRYLPKVPGLGIQVAAGLDKTDAYEGVTYIVPGKKDEQPLHELSESEYDDLWIAILEAEDAKFLFFENMNRYGNNVVDRLNRFIKSGGNVFYTLMDRDKEDIGISFKSKIE